MKNPAVAVLSACLYISTQVSWATRIQATRLPTGPTKVVSALSGDATTTYYLEASKNHNHPVGVLTSIVDTFINGGTTTEYMTQHLGTHIQDKYAKIQTTSSREYYRIAPTAASNEHSVRPTGLIGSSLSLEVNGPATTYHTVEQYRTYLDGHYAQLVSSISNIITDPAFVSATPIFNPRAVSSVDPSVDPEEKRGLEELRKTLYSSYDFDIKPTKAYKYNVATRTVGHRKFAVRDPSILDRVIENEIEELSRFEDELSGNSLKLPRSLDLDAVESETIEDIVPAKPDIAIPTWTVGSDGELNIPTPSVEVLQPEKKIEPTVAHRFAAPQKTKLSLDSVTYVGFVDFTTTIDDTVVIFRPKDTFQTVNHNLVRPPPIKPSRTSKVPSFSASRSDIKRPKFLPAPHPEVFSNSVESEPEIISSNVGHAESERFSTSPVEENIKKHTSGIDALKDLLAGNKRTRFGALPTNRLVSQSSSQSSQRSNQFVSSSARPGVRPSAVSNSEKFSSSSVLTQQSENEDISEIISTIDPTSDVELVFKTLYTTYTYFTTFFRESTTRVKSREEVISNVMTLTNILKSSDANSISCELDSSCLLQSTQVPDPFSDGFIGRPNTKPSELPRGGDEGRRVAGDELVIPSDIGVDDNAVLRTFYTTYTYFSTLYNDGTTSVSTRTEVYSNVQSASVQLDILSPNKISILPKEKFEIISTSPIPDNNRITTNAPLRRLEISSVRPVRLQSDLTTPETPTDSEDSTTERPSTDRAPRFNFGRQQTTTELDEEETTTEWINPTPIITTTNDYQEEDGVQIITARTPALTEEVTEVVTSATTESEEEVDAATTESIAKTLYTTFTYFTTLFKSGTSVVTSNLETVTNIATDINVSPSVVEPSVTFFTTFTYWTTSIVPGGSTVITSREETITDILPASVTNDINQATAKPEVETTQAPELPTTTNNPREEAEEIEIVSTLAPSASIKPAIFTFYNTRYEGDETIVDTILSTSGTVQPSTVVPDLESSQVDVIVSSGISPNGETPTIQPTSSFQDIDDDLVLTSSVEDSTDNNESVSVKPSRVRQRVAFPRTGNTFAPVIRLNIRDRKFNRPIRPRGEISTTVATRFRTSVKPTLIATLASSAAPQNTPTFGGSSRGGFLASSSLLNRGQNRFSSSASPTSASKSVEASISPSRVLINRGSATFQPSSNSDKSSSSVKINPIRLRRPNPFRARFKELQAERLAKLRKKNRVSASPTASSDDNERPTVPIPNFPSPPGGVGGVGAPIFISSQTETVRRPKNNADSSIDVPDSVKLRRERARAKIKNLFSRSRPSFNRLNFNPSRQDGQQRRKRQVSTYGAEFGSRTRARHSYVSHPNRRTQIPSESQYYQDPSSYNTPFTAFTSFTSKRQTQQRNLDDYFYEDDTDSSFTSSNSVRTPSSSSRQANTNFRRQAPASEVPDTRGSLPSRGRSRSRSRFNPAQSTTSKTILRPRTRTRTLNTRNFNRQQPTTTEKTTTKRPTRLRSRTNPRTLSTSSRDRNRFPSNTRTSSNRFTKTRDSIFSTGNRQSSVNKHVKVNNRPGTRNRNPVIDLDDYYTDIDDYYTDDDYYTEIQSSQQAVPDFITVTHQVPIATVVPVVANGITEFRDILTTSPSLQAIAATALKSTDVSNSPVIYANAQTIFPQAGVKQILFDALRATETTSITFTPTRINLGFGLQGRKTSFSHIVPTTVYNIETVTTRIAEPIDQGQLLNSLLQQILLGGGVLPSQGTNPNPLFNTAAPIQAAPVQAQPATQFVTHSSTYVTTITSIESTVLPITLRGKVISTTLIDSSESIITATEFSTETIVNTPAVAPTRVQPQILPTAPPQQGINNPLVASLLPALLQAQLANPLAQQQDALLLQQQQQQEELLRIQQEALLQQQQEALIQQQAELLRQQQQEQILAEQREKHENELFNEQLLAQINLDDFSDEDLANLDLDSVIDAVINSEKGTKAPIHFPKKNLFDTPQPVQPTQVVQQIEPTAETPKTSVITIYKSGSRPGDFTTTLKTITLASNRRKRDTLLDIRPSKVELVEVTEAPTVDSSLHRELESSNFELFVPDMSELLIQSGLVGELETLYIPIQPHQSLQETKHSF